MPTPGQPTTLQERVQIRDLAAAGYSDPEISALLGRPLPTVRKWRRIAQRQSRPDLSSHFGRRTTGALSTFPADLQAHIRHLRETHRGWGAKTIRSELQRDPVWRGQPLPSRARIAAFLKQAGLTRRYQKRRDPPQPPATQATAPHEAWQLDAQGAVMVTGVGTVSIINVVDEVSHLKVESTPIAGHQPATPDYQASLRRAFTSCGLPERISFDHGSAFYDNTTPSPFPTLLHLWLIALGVLVRFTRKRRPTDHALVERTHQTMTQQTVTGQTWPDLPALWAGLDDRRAFLNGWLPMTVLGEQAPLQAYPDAGHAGRAYRPEWEAELLDLRRVDAFVAQQEWFRQTNCHGEFWLGQQRYNVGKRWGKTEVAIQYDPLTREIVCRPGGGAEVVRFPIKGLTVTELMGEGTPAQRLPAQQLLLPFPRTVWQEAERVERLPAMAA
jgi:hypothetical protein